MKYIAWLVVAVPLGWGLMKSVEKSIPLFSNSVAAPSPPVVMPKP